MKVVHLSNSQGKVKTRYVGFSFAYLIFGPLYLLFRLRFLAGILLLLGYYYFLPIPGLDFFVNPIIYLVHNPTAKQIIHNIFFFFRTGYAKYFGIIFICLFHLLACFFVEGQLVRRLIKKKHYAPITESDARLLISVHAVKNNVTLAGEGYQRDNNNDVISMKYQDVPYIIDSNRQNEVSKMKQLEKNKKIEDLNEIYRLGQLTREEYEIRRASIIKMYK